MQRARVKTLDMFPNPIKPVLHTIQEGLYKGDDAGHGNFIPVLHNL